MSQSKCESTFDYNKKEWNRILLKLENVDPFPFSKTNTSHAMVLEWFRIAKDCCEKARNGKPHMFHTAETYLDFCLAGYERLIDNYILGDKMERSSE